MYGKWAGASLIAGLAAGATLGAISAHEHNKKVDDFTGRLETERAQQAIAMMQTGAVKG